MPNWRQRRKQKQAQREIGRKTGKLSTQDVVDNANNDLNVLDNAKPKSRSGYTSSASSELVKSDIKKETTGESSYKGEIARVESAKPHSGGVSTILEYSPISSSDKTIIPPTSTKTTDTKQFSGVYDAKGRPVKSASAEQHYTSEQSKGKLKGFVDIDKTASTSNVKSKVNKKQQRQVKRTEKQKTKSKKRDEKATARFNKYMEKQ